MSEYKKSKEKNIYNNNLNKYGKSVLLVIIFLFIAVLSYFNSSQYIISDSAIIDGRIINISPKVSGNVSHLYVEENQEVKKGDLLLEIDPTYYEIRLNQSIINLRNAKARYSIEESNKENSGSLNINEHSKTHASRFNFSKHKFNSYESMYDDETIPKESEKDKSCLLDNASEVNIQKQEESKDNIQQDEEVQYTKNDIKKLENEVEQAKLDLSNTKVYASRDGTITHINVEEGDYIEISQQILSVIPKKVCVLACFQITDTNTIKEGQTAIIKIAAYPNRKFKGTVESVQNYSDEFSNILFTKNNDTDYKKVVVKISFIEDYSAYNINPSSKVEVKIKTE